LDCGACVDLQSTGDEGWWPVLLATQSSAPELLLRRMLAADPDSLLRRAANGMSALHLAAVANTDALKQLLGSGLPHLAEAINAVATLSPMHEAFMASRSTPLHCACSTTRWDAALALLAAGARVDIAGFIDGIVQTISEWAYSSVACKHRGVKLAVAARVREHAAAAAAAAAKVLLSGGAGSCAGEVPAAASTVEAAAGGGASRPGFGAAANADVVASEAASAAPVLAAGKGKGKQPEGRKGHRGAARNRAEDLPSADKTTELQAPCAATAAPATGSHHISTGGSVAVPASAAAPAAATSATRVDYAAVAAAAAAGRAVSCNAPETPAPDGPSLDVPADLLSALALATGAYVDALGLPAQNSVAAICAEGSASDAVPLDPSGQAAAADRCAASTSTREPGAESGSGASASTCEPIEDTTAACSAQSETAGSGGSADNTAAVAALIAAILSAQTGAAAVRRHLAALSELARDHAATAALGSQGAVAAVGAALLRHGLAVSRAAGAVLTALSAAAAEGSEGEEAAEEGDA
jgi:hypothetical protein